jgi:hypothetical protein
MPVVRISNQLATAVPQSGVASRAVTAGATASNLIVAALNVQTQGIYWTVTGANARVTFDGSTPTATNGHQIANGEEGIWSPILAASARIIRENGTDAVFYITEINYL